MDDCLTFAKEFAEPYIVHNLNAAARDVLGDVYDRVVLMFLPEDLQLLIIHFPWFRPARLIGPDFLKVSVWRETLLSLHPVLRGGCGCQEEEEEEEEARPGHGWVGTREQHSSPAFILQGRN